MWFGNTYGLVQLNSGWKNRARKASYALKFTEIRVNGNTIIDPMATADGNVYDVKLAAEQNNITVCFSDFTYTDPKYAVYEYKLDGCDDGWQVLSGASELTLYNLDSGRHTLRVRHTGKPTTEIRLDIHVAASVSAATCCVNPAVVGRCGRSVVSVAALPCSR